jgi:electron transport complex protein RnfB
VQDLNNLYEKLRILLSPSIGIPLPKNTTVEKLLINMFTEKEALVVAEGIRKAIRPVRIKTIQKRIGLPESEIQEILDHMLYTGKILKKGSFYVVMPYLPGEFELYFTFKRDDPERMKKAGEAHFDLIKSGFQLKYLQKDYRLIRVLPAVEPTIKEIAVKRSIDTDHFVLPFEILEKYLARQKIFALERCSCRTAAELSGNPCKRTHENFCVAAGSLAKIVIKSGAGRQVSLPEVMDILKKAEKEGLVHESVNIQKSSVFICNCCPCCCAVLHNVKEFHNKAGTMVSNFQPKIDPTKCKLCETCMKKCPMDVISHVIDGSTGKMVFAMENCIGCGVCSSNCPEGAIALRKVRDVVPVKGLVGLLRTFKNNQKK